MGSVLSICCVKGLLLFSITYPNRLLAVLIESDHDNKKRTQKKKKGINGHNSGINIDPLFFPFFLSFLP